MNALPHSLSRRDPTLAEALFLDGLGDSVMPCAVVYSLDRPGDFGRLRVAVCAGLQWVGQVYVTTAIESYGGDPQGLGTRAGRDLLDKLNSREAALAAC